MREIKFRAWTKEKDGTWRGPWYGGFSIHATGTIADRELLPTGDIEVEQYTGLKDKNGVEIYEGDILDPELPDGSGAYRIEWTGHGWSTYQDHGFLGYSTSSEHVVVGNIYEHKELLK